MGTATKHRLPCRYCNSNKESVCNRRFISKRHVCKRLSNMHWIKLEYKRIMDNKKIVSQKMKLT